MDASKVRQAHDAMANLAKVADMLEQSSHDVIGFWLKTGVTGMGGAAYAGMPPETLSVPRHLIPEVLRIIHNDAVDRLIKLGFEPVSLE